ncbi:hypothetical protein VNO80_11293 [Phaseolus coccineus]|uniref:Uncharacterized protein n=1 Tax=Phaseolus coccineus TaxID=3886 RepID=A0AAN9RER3_PHACN
MPPPPPPKPPLPLAPPSVSSLTPFPPITLCIKGRISLFLSPSNVSTTWTARTELSATLSLHQYSRLSRPPFNFGPLSYTLQLIFRFLHLSLHLLFYTFFSSSFYLFNLLSSIKIFRVTESFCFSFCIAFPSSMSQYRERSMIW